eukprot:7017616-Pyramimonas_sp.AAC.1
MYGAPFSLCSLSAFALLLDKCYVRRAFQPLQRGDGRAQAAIIGRVRRGGSVQQMAQRLCGGSHDLAGVERLHVMHQRPAAAVVV